MAIGCKTDRHRNDRPHDCWHSPSVYRRSSSSVGQRRVVAALRGGAESALKLASTLDRRQHLGRKRQHDAHGQPRPLGLRPQRRPRRGPGPRRQPVVSLVVNPHRHFIHPCDCNDPYRNESSHPNAV